MALLAQEIFKVTSNVASSQHQCSSCDYAEIPIDDRLGYVLHADDSITHTTNYWINTMSQSTYRRCPDCNKKMKQIVYYNDAPYILILEYPFKNIETSHSLEIVSEDGKINIWKLRGIMYTIVDFISHDM